MGTEMLGVKFPRYIFCEPSTQHTKLKGHIDVPFLKPIRYHNSGWFGQSLNCISKTSTNSFSCRGPTNSLLVDVN